MDINGLHQLFTWHLGQSSDAGVINTIDDEHPAGACKDRYPSSLVAAEYLTVYHLHIFSFLKIKFYEVNISMNCNETKGYVFVNL